MGGAITQGIAGQWIFWINVPIGLLTIPVAFRRVDESFGPRSAPDVIGPGLVTTGALGIVWGLVRGDSAGWGSTEVVAALAAGDGARAGVRGALPAIQNAVVSSVVPAGLGKAWGTFNTMRQLGGVFGVATLVAVFTGAGGYASPQLFSDGFEAAIAAAAGLSLAAAVTSLWLPARRQAAAGTVSEAPA